MAAKFLPIKNISWISFHIFCTMISFVNFEISLLVLDSSDFIPSLSPPIPYTLSPIPRLSPAYPLHCLPDSELIPPDLRHFSDSLRLKAATASDLALLAGPKRTKLKRTLILTESCFTSTCRPFSRPWLAGLGTPQRSSSASCRQRKASHWRALTKSSEVWLGRKPPMSCGSRRAESGVEKGS